jgi:hypothetical protein
MSQSDATSATLEHVRRTLANAQQRGWHLFLLGDRPMLLASMASLSPGLIHRLLQLRTSRAHLLVESLS